MLARILLIAFCFVSMSMSATAAAAAPDQPLADAAQARDVEAVRALLRDGSDVNAAQSDGMTALHWAAYHENVEIARLLIDAGANLTATTRIGDLTPLFMSSSNGDAEITGLLLAAGADANSSGPGMTTALMVASASGSVETVKSLLAKGADIDAKESSRDQTALMFAAALDRSAVVRELAVQGADLNSTSRVERIGKVMYDEDGNPMPAESRTGATTFIATGRGSVTGMGGNAALHYAAREGHMASVRALVETGADLDTLNALDASTPLVSAITNGHYDVSQYMVDSGADLNMATIEGYMPLYATLESRWAPVAWTPTASTAATDIVQQERTYLELMESMLRRGANPNAAIVKTLWFSPPHHSQLWIETGGATAFWRAAQATDVEAMKLLVAYGADPDVRSVENTTSLSVAAGVGWAGNFSTNSPDSFMAAARYLVEEVGIDIDVADEHGYTALMGAAYRGDNEMVEYLVEQGADLEARNEYGWSATEMANGPYVRSSVPVAHPDTVALLEGLGGPKLIVPDDEEILGIIKRKLDTPDDPQP